MHIKIPVSCLIQSFPSAISGYACEVSEEKGHVLLFPYLLHAIDNFESWMIVTRRLDCGEQGDIIVWQDSAAGLPDWVAVAPPALTDWLSSLLQGRPPCWPCPWARVCGPWKAFHGFLEHSSLRWETWVYSSLQPQTLIVHPEPTTRLPSCSGNSLWRVPLDSWETHFLAMPELWVPPALFPFPLSIPPFPLFRKA